MKKIYLAFILLFIGILAQGQGQIFLYQGFASGYWPPAGWTPLPIGPQWTLSQTNKAGGVLPEARFQGFEYTGTARLIAPIIDMTGIDTAILSFKYFPEVDTANIPILGVSTRSGNSVWHDVWQTTLVNRNEPREFEVLITNGDLGNPDFQLSFFLSGDLSRLFNFYIDDIRLFFPTTTDGKLDEILTPAQIEGPEPVAARVINLGNTRIDEVCVSWLTNEGILHDSLFTDLNLGLFDSFTFQFHRWWVSPLGDYKLKMWLSSVNGAEDPYHPNDTLVKNINYSIHPRPWRIPCLETFTANWCQPCSIWAESYDPWLEDHPYNVVIKYQQSDDPYATPEGHVRIEYYDLHAIPYTYCNGVLVANVDTNDLDTAYYPACLLHSDFIINSSYTIDNKVITVNNNIFPYVTTYGTRVQTVIVEKTTYGNVGSNGQTEFHNVEMKMFPEDGNGEPVDFIMNYPYSQTYTANLEYTNIEEFDDLLIAVFIQLDSGREILQSRYSLKDYEYSGEDRLSVITLDGEPLAGFNPDVAVYEAELPPGAVETPVVLGIPMDDKAMMITNQAFDIPGSAVIDVYPESRGKLKRYIVSFSIGTGIADPGPQVISIFPNPTNDRLYITGIEFIKAELYSLDGKLTLETGNRFNNAIDLSMVKSGIYILSLTGKNGITVRKKIVIM